MSCWNAELGCGNLKQCVTGLFGPADFVIVSIHSLFQGHFGTHLRRQSALTTLITLSVGLLGIVLKGVQ